MVLLAAVQDTTEAVQDMLEMWSAQHWAIFFSFLACASYMLWSTASNIPTVKYSRWLPNYVNRLLFTAYGARLIQEGYEKYTNVPFRVLKPDGDLVILPSRYVEELRSHRPEVMSSLDAQYNNIIGKYTQVLVESHLPSDTVLRRLNPDIARVVPDVLEELEYAFQEEMPECDDKWIPVNAYNLVLRLMARATSRIFVGPSICRNEAWLSAVSSYTMNVGMTLVLLRPVPKFLRPIIAPFLPSVRAINTITNYIRSEILVPTINARRQTERNNLRYEKPDDFLQWMMDSAEDNTQDREPAFLAHNLFVLLSLGASHTSSMLMTHVLYDLVEMPEYAGPIREEIRQVFEDGWYNATKWQLEKLQHLDSFMKEVQRFHPSGEVSGHRYVRTPLALSDGFRLPAGTHTCFAAGPLTRDASNIPSPLPSTFSGFRWTHDPNTYTRNFVNISPTYIHFGYGRQACPGRHFAVIAIKAIMSRLISEYEFAWPEGRSGRPGNLRNGEQTSPDVFAEVLVRKREGVQI